MIEAPEQEITPLPPIGRKYLAGRVVASGNVSREEWLAVRRRGIGGSDVAAIAGLSAYKTPYTLWLDKRGELEDDEAGEAAYWGNVLEPVVAGEFAKRTGHRIARAPGTLQHQDYDWMLVNLDRVVMEEGAGRVSALLECKTTSLWNADDWQDDQIPFAAALQTQHGMAVTGLETGYVVGLIGGQRLVIVKVERDDELIDMVLKLESSFWERVVNNDPPAIDGQPATSKLISKLYDVDPGKVVDLPSQADTWIKLREQFRSEEAAAKKLKEAAENELKVLLGEAEIGLLDGQEVVTWKETKRDSYVAKASTFRTLRIKGAGK